MPPTPGGEKIALVCAITTNALKPRCSTRLTRPVKPSILEWSHDDREHDRRVEEHAEVVAVVGVLVEVAEVGDDPAAERPAGCRTRPDCACRAAGSARRRTGRSGRRRSTAAGSRCTASPASGRTRRGGPCRCPARRTTRRGAAAASVAVRQAVVVIEPQAELEAWHCRP